MSYKFAHQNFNVIDLEKSIKFYEEALDLTVIRQRTADDGSYAITFMGDNISNFSLELTWLRDFDKEKYDLGDEEFHLAFVTDNYEESFKKHSEMGCIVLNNEKLGIYFITDPDGYWIEIVPVRK